jgi:hypothetical protein
VHGVRARSHSANEDTPAFIRNDADEVGDRRGRQASMEYARLCMGMRLGSARYSAIADGSPGGCGLWAGRGGRRAWHRDPGAIPGYGVLVSLGERAGGEQCPQCGESDLRPYGNGSKWACPKCYFIVPCCEGGERAARASARPGRGAPTADPGQPYCREPSGEPTTADIGRSPATASRHRCS